MFQTTAKGHGDVALRPSSVSNTHKHEEAFIKAMYEAGVPFNETLITDGGIHRFSTDADKKGSKDGWYVFYGLAGAFGDWSTDIWEKWSAARRPLSLEEKQTLTRQIEKSKKAFEEEKVQKHAKTAGMALEKWNSFSETGVSPYLSNKKVEPIGVRFKGEWIVVPLKDVTGKLWSLQWISPYGTKRFLLGSRKKGCFHTLGNLEDGKPIVVVEGYATGASIYMATQHSVVIAFDAGNLDNVIGDLKKAYPRSSLLIAGDDDKGGEKNVGRDKGEDAVRKYGCQVIFPTFSFKSLDSNPTDFNDLHVLEGLEEVKRQVELALSQKTLKVLNLRELLTLEVNPREMILGPIIPEQGLSMIHAPRGIGKTHVSLMIAYTVATGSSMFQGRWMSPSPRKVLFVDGEMPLAVMQERLAKIVTSSETELSVDDNLLLITPDIQKQGLADLSTLEGQQVIEEHLKDVKLLILDNYSALCRRGRENEAESWIPLQEWFLTLRRRGISVLLIHHSNKTGGQRGTSRKEDLLDTIITLKKPEDYDPREGARFEVHYEKARGFYGEDASPFEVHLKEEENGTYQWLVRSVQACQLDKIVHLRSEGLTQRDIAQETGLSPATVNRRLKEAQGRDAVTP